LFVTPSFQDRLSLGEQILETMNTNLAQFESFLNGFSTPDRPPPPGIGAANTAGNQKSAAICTYLHQSAHKTTPSASAP
jgi:hypothetical protein